jgi:hypothetical protein
VDEEDLEDDLPSNYSGVGDRKVSHPFSVSSFSDSSSSDLGIDAAGDVENVPMMSPIDPGTYIKISGTRRIGRLRDTVYSDPGNPFDEEEDDATPMFEHEATRESPVVPHRNITPSPPAEFWRNSWSCQSKLSKRKGFLKIDTKERRSHEDGKKVRSFSELGRTASMSSSSSDEYDNVAPPSAFWMGRSGSKNRKRSDDHESALEHDDTDDPTIELAQPSKRVRREQREGARGQAEAMSRAESERQREGRSDLENGNKTPILSPTPRRSGTPTLIREHSFLTRESDAVNDEKGKTKEESEDVNRDTRFYKFYSGVLGEYVGQ